MGATKKILTIVTNVSEYEKVGYRTGLWLGELTHFYDVAEEAGYAMDIASPSGGTVPIDAESLTHKVLDDLGTGERYKDRAFMDRLKNTMKVEDAKLEDYDAIYMTGGHGVSFDFPRSRALADLTARFYESGRVAAAVCHGPAGLLEVKTSDGEYLIKGKKLTAFSWKEEELADRAEAVPFSLEDELKKRGALYETASLPFAEHVVRDGLLITGQNPGSARPVAEAVVKCLTTG
ncbi:MAG: type 1 glutamine amidotransferase domain-containing protein [Rhodospirillales bacterium]